MKREAYTVELPRPDGVSVDEMADYIKEAVECWSGGGSPSDPLFGMFKESGNEVKVWRRRTAKGQP